MNASGQINIKMDELLPIEMDLTVKSDSLKPNASRNF